MYNALEVIHDKDPKQEIWDDLTGYIDGMEPLGAQVLVGIYKRPERLQSGVYIPSETMDEDNHQGKIGLVLKLGPIAFEEDSTHRFGTVIPKIGDWVLYRVPDTFRFVLGKRHCRFVEDVNIRAIIARPDSAI